MTISSKTSARILDGSLSGIELLLWLGLHERSLRPQKIYESRTTRKSASIDSKKTSQSTHTVDMSARLLAAPLRRSIPNTC
jgi:hypothetical protein